MPWDCYSCGRNLPDKAIEHAAMTEDGEQVSVGSDCIKHIKAAGEAGHTNDKTGVTLWSLNAFDTRDEVA